MEKKEGETRFQVVDKKPLELGGRKLPEIPEEIQSNVKEIKQRLREDFELSKKIGHIKEKDMPTEREKAQERSHFRSREILKEDKSVEKIMPDLAKIEDKFGKSGKE